MGEKWFPLLLGGEAGLLIVVGVVVPRRVVGFSAVASPWWGSMLSRGEGSRSRQHSGCVQLLASVCLCLSAGWLPLWGHYDVPSAHARPCVTGPRMLSRL